ncbi:MAG: T9SS type A sorting domain-containing protein [Gammaproteobacteria bacterium]
MKWLLMLLMPIGLQAQTFQMLYDASSSYCKANSIISTTDGGYIAVGQNERYDVPASDMLVVKLDGDGDTLWTRTFGGNQAEAAYEVIQTWDGGYMITGKTKSFGVGNYDMLFVKLNSNSTIEWTKTYGGPGYDAAESIEEINGGFITYGWTQSFGAGGWDGLLMRLDTNGDTLWTRTYGGIGDDYPFSLVATFDGGYLLAGATTSFGVGKYDCYIIKTDSNGDTLWTKTFGSVEDDFLTSGFQVPDSGFVLVGFTDRDTMMKADVLLIKTDSDGNIEWSKTYGDSAFQRAYDITATSNGDYIVAGQGWRSGYSDIGIIKTDTNGDTLWTKTFGNSHYDECNGIDTTNDGAVILGGLSVNPNGDTVRMYIIKADSNGSSNQCQEYQTQIIVKDVVLSIASADFVSSSAPVEVGNPNVGPTNTMIKDSIVCSTVGIDDIGQPTTDLVVFPNPTTGLFQVKGEPPITVYNLLGNLMIRESTSRQVNLSGYPSGIYIVIVGETATRLLLAK